MADSSTEETDQFRWKATEVETLRTSWALKEPTSGIDTPSGMNYFAQKERNSILGHSARRATRRHKKAMAQRRQRPSPVQINAEGPHRAQKKVDIKTSCKVGQGLNQEGARDGTCEQLRLGNKLWYVRETGIQTHKGDN